MKDKEVKEEIRLMRQEFHNRVKMLERTGLSVKNCPKCGHLVLSIADWAEVLPRQLPRIASSYRCLTCGCRFAYKETELLIEESK